MQSLLSYMPGNTALSRQNKGEVSIYTGIPAEPKDIIMAAAMIKKAFPSLPKEFYDIFDDRIRANEFTAERLFHAVMHVIDTCIYPLPTIANFISYDKTYKVYSYEEMVKGVNDGLIIWSHYKKIQPPGRHLAGWTHQRNIEAFGLEKYIIDAKYLRQSLLL